MYHHVLARGPDASVHDTEADSAEELDGLYREHVERPNLLRRRVRLAFQGSRVEGCDEEDICQQADALEGRVL